MVKVEVVPFNVILACFQVVTLVIYCMCTKYSEDASSVGAYGLFQNIHVMIFVGFGFLMTFMRKYGWGAVGFTYLFAIVAAQWAVLLVGFFHEVHHVAKHGGKMKTLELDVYSFMNGEFAAGAVLISFGGVIGKISHTQMLAVTMLECIVYAANEMIVYAKFAVVDAGGTMAIHAFGAYFGLALSLVVGYTGRGVKEAETSHKNGLFAMIGTLFLWMYWPSFNAGPVGTPLEQQRVIVNTLLSIGASALIVYLASLSMRGGKFEMEDVQNATLAGGVAMGAAATMRVEPVGALLIGCAAGFLSNVGFAYGSAIMDRLGINDTCGIHNLHGMPAVLGAIISAVVASLATAEKYPDGNLATVFPAMAACGEGVEDPCGRSAGEQAGFQLLSLLVTVGLGISGGLFTGFIVTRPALFEPLPADANFEDAGAWNIEDGDIAELLSSVLPEKVSKSAVQDNAQGTA